MPESNPAAADKPLCDLVMKGGITSGVVYPQLIAELADTYRFKNIGGTSAGAIAAAGCAAAEHGRLTGQRADAFAELMKLPRQLKERSADGHSMLFHLFQPAAPVRKHFAVLVSMLNASPLAAAGRAVLAMVRQFWGIALLGVLLAFVLFTPVVLVAAPTLSLAAASGVALAVLLLWWLWAAYGLCRLEALKASPWKAPLLWWVFGLLASAAILGAIGGTAGGVALLWAVLAGGIAAPLTIGLVLALSGLRFGNTLVAGMHGNGYGLCSGRTVEAGAGHAGLTDWLSGYFEGLAGHHASHPLVFGDLWNAPLVNGRFADVKPADRRVNLEVMTSAVSQQMCYAIPFRGDQGLYYDPQEWRKLFPDEVMKWLDGVSAAEGAEVRAAGEDLETVVHELNGERRVLSRLPSNANLPLVVAVRMSLSFPALLSAVPLYAVDFSLKLNQCPKGQPPLDSLMATRVWFSDGGIASNMPLHFFDSPLPGHPTFAINLKSEHPDHKIDATLPPGQQPGRVYLPDSNVGGERRYWPAPADGSSLGGLIGFVFSIVDTMQNWRDEIQFPYPGYRDRIVQISQLKDEGGLNLDMPDRNIENLSAAGRVAAQKLRARFHAPPGQLSEGWRYHRQQRLRILLGVFERMAKDLGRSLAAGRWDEALEDIPPHDYSAAHKAQAFECMQRIDELAKLLHDEEPSLESRAPKPRASMRIAPRI
ncbi:patatin-like phospholipase family protein [Hydrogenophaga flava]|uniref:patatin-like phospholipase family protein n=1 Tax=Hydrogenophaga flava TaxID=65657 RepID=UPI000A90E662|nr:patatin-like phospholipase family protein [Hydrogenophaga flava]